MGTRSLICVRINKTWVVAQYSQWDGYPEGQGRDIFNFLQVTENIARLRAGLAHIYQPTGEGLADVNTGIEEVSKLILARRLCGFDLTFQASNPRKNKFPSLSRGTGANILAYIADANAAHKLPIDLDLEFANDSLYCEWAYIVDLDEESFKVFGGCEEKHGNHPFKDVGTESDKVPRFVTEFPFAQLHDMTEAQYIKDCREKAALPTA